MKRRWTGFLKAAGIALLVDLTIIATLGTKSPTATTAWWFVNFPTVPLMFCCVSLAPPQLGDDDQSGWDTMMVTAMFFWSCLTWGGLGWLIGWGNEGLKMSGKVRESATDPNPAEPK